MAKIITKEQFAQVVFDQYIQASKPATFQELAVYAGCSVSVLRKIFATEDNHVSGVTVDNFDKPVMCEVHKHVLRHERVRTLVPTRRYMREKYKELHQNGVSRQGHDDQPSKPAETT